MEDTWRGGGCSTWKVWRGGEACSHCKGRWWGELTALFSYLLRADAVEGARLFTELHMTGQGVTSHKLRREICKVVANASLTTGPESRYEKEIRNEHVLHLLSYLENTTAMRKWDTVLRCSININYLAFFPLMTVLWKPCQCISNWNSITIAKPGHTENRSQASQLYCISQMYNLLVKWNTLWAMGTDTSSKTVSLPTETWVWGWVSLLYFHSNM